MKRCIVRHMREGLGVTLVILAWIAGSALWYFQLWDTTFGLIAAVAVLIAVPVWAFWDR
jgi:hypothetical protein